MSSKKPFHFEEILKEIDHEKFCNLENCGKLIKSF